VKEKDILKDLKILEAALSDARGKVRGQIAEIGRKRIERRGKLSGISDHAVVRYLERTGRLDPADIRREIGDMVRDSVAFEAVDGLWHSKTGMIFVIEEGNVVTVLGRDQAEKYLGQGLMGGGVADYDAPLERTPVPPMPKLGPISEGDIP
jgi:hypothetical protein